MPGILVCSRGCGRDSDVVEILQGICLDVVVFLHLEMHNVNDYRLYNGCP